MEGRTQPWQAWKHKGRMQPWQAWKQKGPRPRGWGPCCDATRVSSEDSASRGEELDACALLLLIVLLPPSRFQEWASLREAVGSATEALAAFGAVAQGLALNCLGRSELGTVPHP